MLVRITILRLDEDLSISFESYLQVAVTSKNSNSHESEVVLGIEILMEVVKTMRAVLIP